MKYLIIIKTKELCKNKTYEFPNQKMQEKFIADITTKYPGIIYTKTTKEE